MVKAYFFDTSALVKRYVNERGSSWVQSITASTAGNTIIVARITWVEVLSALARLRREGKLGAVDLATAILTFRHDWDTQYQVVELDQALTVTAGQLVQRHTLRAYDSVQLASALKLKPAFAKAALASFSFVCADKRLLSVAQAEGLVTQNPNNHP